MILVSCSLARVLFDSGASHSFISYSFAKSLGLTYETLAQLLAVTTPVSGLTVLTHICRRCTIKIVYYDWYFDLILLDLSDFDIIIGMDWLSQAKAIIDCYRRRVTFRAPNGDTLHFIGDRRYTPLPTPMDTVVANIWAEDTDQVVTEYPHIV